VSDRRRHRQAAAWSSSALAQVVNAARVSGADPLSDERALPGEACRCAVRSMQVIVLWYDNEQYAARRDMQLATTSRSYVPFICLSIRAHAYSKFSSRSVIPSVLYGYYSATANVECRTPTLRCAPLVADSQSCCLRSDRPPLCNRIGTFIGVENASVVRDGRRSWSAAEAGLAGLQGVDSNRRMDTDNCAPLLSDYSALCRRPSEAVER